MILTQEPHPNVTPLDLRQTSFKSAMHGFNRDEATAFILEIANDYENALRDNDRLRQALERLDAALNQHRELEDSLKNTLMTVRKAFEDVRETANLEGARIVRDAESRAETILQKALERQEDVQREIDGLELKRREAETSIEATISSLYHTLEFVRQVNAISAIAASATTVIASAPGPESSLQETTDSGAALDKPQSSWLRPGVDAPEECLATAPNEKLDEPRPSWLKT